MVPHALARKPVEKRLLTSDLYTYLLSLSRALELAREEKPAAEVRHVSRFASGSSSELFGEARLLLPRILDECEGKLASAERAELRDVIAGIEREFDRIGGG
jgi:hypothetical protein